jgi:hypothetical protein
MRTMTYAETVKNRPKVGKRTSLPFIEIGRKPALDASRTMAVVVATPVKNHDLGFAGAGKPLLAAESLWHLAWIGATRHMSAPTFACILCS